MLSDADATWCDAALADLYRQLLTLRRARIAHGAVSGDTLLVDPGAETATVMDFRNATSSARPDQLGRDMRAVAATAVAVGAPGRRRRIEVSHPGGAGQETASSICIAPRSIPCSARTLRGKRELLNDVRQQAAQAGSIDVPKLVEPRRVSWPTLIMMVGTLIGGWALIGVLLDVSKSFDTVIGAEWLWVIVNAFILSLLVSVAAAIEGIGSVAGALQFGRVLAVEVANSFSALAGGTAAVFATRVRFFQRQGYDASVALSSGAIIAASSWIATGVLFLVSLPFAWGTIHLAATPESGGIRNWCRSSWPSWCSSRWSPGWRSPCRGCVGSRPRSCGRIRDVWGNLEGARQLPRKLVLLVGGSSARELVVAMTLSVSLRAFDDHLRLPTLIVVITLAAIIGGISPSPGGMGVVEAGLILGLTAAGVSEADATAAVFIQRLFTSYLPPIWGWVTLVWMRKREYL